MRNRTRMWLLGSALIVAAVFAPSLSSLFSPSSPGTKPAVTTSHPASRGPYSTMTRDLYTLSAESLHWKAEWVIEEQGLISFTTLSSPSQATDDLTVTWKGPVAETPDTVSYSFRTNYGGAGAGAGSGGEKLRNGQFSYHETVGINFPYDTPSADLSVTWNGHTEPLTFSVARHQSWKTTTSLPGQVVHSEKEFQDLVNAAKSAEPVSKEVSLNLEPVESRLHRQVDNTDLLQHYDWNQWAQTLADNSQIVLLPEASSGIARDGAVVDRPPVECFSLFTHNVTFSDAYHWTDVTKIPSVQGRLLPVGGKELMGFSFSNLSSPDVILSSWGMPEELLERNAPGASVITHMVLRGRQIGLYVLGQDESHAAVQCSTCGTSTLYIPDTGVVECTFGPTWNDHGQVAMTYTHTGKATDIGHVDLSDTDGSGLAVGLQGGNDGWTLTTPPAKY